MMLDWFMSELFWIIPHWISQRYWRKRAITLFRKERRDVHATTDVGEIQIIPWDGRVYGNADIDNKRIIDQIEALWSEMQKLRSDVGQLAAKVDSQQAVRFE